MPEAFSFVRADILRLACRLRTVRFLGELKALNASEAENQGVSDDLSKPLGLAPRRASRARSLALAKPLAFACLGLVAAIGCFALVARDPLGGEPAKVAMIEIAPASLAPAAVAAVPVPPAGAAKENGGRLTAADLEAESGVRVIRRGGDVPGAIVLRIPDDPATVKLAPAPDKRLVDKARVGLLPRIGADGARPSDVYARPAGPSKAGRPRIAIYVTGLGIGVQATADAIAKLPGPVTLAFAPYGADVERQVAKARDEGHEVMLQVPMEPFDFPDNDPGPQTLLAGLKPEQNLERLQWLMSRFTGYIGITNYMGAKFTASDAALAPVMRELAGRGLIFVDDASSMRSIAGDVANAQGLPNAKADVVIDAQPKASDIDAALQRLEALARARGSAIGVATALPASVDRLSRWAKSLDAKGIDLVPVSATVQAAKRMG